MTTTLPVLVGISGQDDTAGLRWAATEAELLGTRLTLVHVVEPRVIPLVPGGLTAPPPMVDVGQLALERAAHELGRPATTTLLEGPPGRVLAELATEARLVVLTHHRRGLARRLVTSSTAVTVAGHAHCPVASVPTDWTDGTDGAEGRSPWVTVGVHEAGLPAAVLEQGLEIAARHGWGVRLLHTWKVEPMYDDLIRQRVGDQRCAEVRRHILESVAPVAEEFPGVDIKVLVEHDWPADALTRWSRDSAVVVVGRHAHHAPVPRHLGSVARTLLDNSEAPVVVVPV